MKETQAIKKTLSERCSERCHTLMNVLNGAVLNGAF